MVPVPATTGRTPSLQELFERRCFLLGITEPSRVAKLWAQEKVKYDKASQKKPKKPRQR